MLVITRGYFSKNVTLYSQTCWASQNITMRAAMLGFRVTQGRLKKGNFEGSLP